VFVWFGALKMFGQSPVFDLIGAMVPWIDPGFLVPMLGWVEVILGVLLLGGWLLRLTLVVLAAHLCGPFLTFLAVPYLMMRNGDPLLLTADGEFVLKNLILISAAIVLLVRTERR